MFEDRGMRATAGAAAVLAGTMLCALPVMAEDKAATIGAKRAEVRKMCDEALATVYKAKPAVKDKVAKAAGYGCFTSFGMSFLVGGAGGHGLVHNSATRKDIYMKMGQASGGIDFGIKKYKEVLVFKDKATLEKFVSSGWEISGGGSATAAAGGKGGTADSTEVSTGAIEVYPMTDTGLAIGVAAGGRKYWKDDELNGPN